MKQTITVLIVLILSSCISERKVAKWLISRPELTRTDSVETVLYVERFDTVILHGIVVDTNYTTPLPSHTRDTVVQVIEPPLQVVIVEHVDTIAQVRYLDVESSCSWDTIYLFDTIRQEVIKEVNVTTVRTTTRIQRWLMGLGVLVAGLTVVWVVMRATRREGEIF